MKRIAIFLALLGKASSLNLANEAETEKKGKQKVQIKRERNKTFEELCEENGFQHEKHKVITEDGYILSLWRIPGLIEEGDLSDTSKTPVIFQHGLLDSAIGWMIHYPEVAPAFVAARAGYDVWLGNSRGSTFSRKHIKYDPDVDKREFWDYSFYEMAMYDVPAFIKEIQEEADGQKVAFIGHSQGST